jgi:guanylate kinase
MKPRKSSLFIISAPSGAGKSTLIQRLLAGNTNLLFSISHTTRLPREGEQNGVDYFFVTDPQFKKMIENNELLEWAEVHGFFYGTSREMLTRASVQGCDLILDIDVQGATKVKKLLPDTISIFILPPSFEALRERLRLRRKDTEEQIAKRIENARGEIQHCNEYDYIIINHQIDTAFEDLNCIVSSQNQRRDHQQEEINAILKSFRTS